MSGFNASASQTDSLHDDVEGYVAHLEALQSVFNAHAAEIGLNARIDVQGPVDAVRHGIILDRVGSFFTREDDSGVLHDAQLMTAMDCIREMLENPGQNGVVLGAMQSGKTTTSLALQLAGPIIYTLTGRRLYPMYLMTSHTSQEDQTNIELTNFLNYYGLIKILRHPSDGDANITLDPGFIRSPTVAYYRGQVLRQALGDIHMGPRLEDFVQRRVHGQRIQQVAELCGRAHAQGFEPILMIDEPQYGASDRMVVNDAGVMEQRPCVLLQIFEAIEEAMQIHGGRHSFVGLSATPYEIHELESVWVVRQYLSANYSGFNCFGGRVISEGVDIEPPVTFGFTDFATQMNLPDVARISLAAYDATPTRFAVFARRLNFTGTQVEYQEMVHRAVRQSILRMVADANDTIGICLRTFNNNVRAADFVRQLDLESSGIEMIYYFGSEYSGISVKRAIRARRHPDRPFVIVVTNRARMGDAFPVHVRWFIDLAGRVSDLNALLQGLLGRACGYNKNSNVLLSDDNQAYVLDYRRTRGGYFYRTSRHSIVVGGFRRGAPTSMVRIRANMNDEVVRSFFARINSEIVDSFVIQDRAELQTRRNRSQGYRTGPILRIASETGLFEHLETPETAEALFPNIPGGFRIVRAGEEIAHTRNASRMLGYDLDPDDQGNCRFTFRWTSDGDSHGGLSSRGYGERDATDRARAGDKLEPQIHMEKYDATTGEIIFDKREVLKIVGRWRAYMVTLPLSNPVRELQQGQASYPNERSVYTREMTEEERQVAGFP
jgi:hypothetical protein